MIAIRVALRVEVESGGAVLCRRPARSGRRLQLAAVCVRVSTEERPSKKLYLGAQIERVLAYATAQGLRLQTIFRDEGVRAGASRRLGFHR